MLKTVSSLYNLRFPRTIVYMLQATEYQPRDYWMWFWRTNDFGKVMHRRTLVLTKKARLLYYLMSFGMLAQYLLTAAWFGWGIGMSQPAGPTAAVVLFVLTPLVWAHLILIPLFIVDYILKKPYVWLLVLRSRKIFSRHPATKIAVAGSYGKTTMKEMLVDVLATAKNVGATPATKNVPISHAKFAKSLKGDEEFLIIEFGEGKPGDIKRFAKAVKPQVGIITGLAPMHLDKYKTLERAGADIFSLQDFVDPKMLFVNADSPAAKGFIKPAFETYNKNLAAGWKISDVKSSIKGLQFSMTRGKQRLSISSVLVGEHQIGPLALVAALAIKFGMDSKQVEKAVAALEPFEHRMELREVGGASIIDDTYNGNIEGMEAGLRMLAQFPAKRKVYVTPGLVDQGAESKAIHERLGQAIASAQPDVVVLMKHSVTRDITHGLSKGGFKGELLVEDDPLHFYQNMDQFIAGGDLVLLQNDWPDNYN